MLTRKSISALFVFFIATATHAQTFEIRTVNEGIGTIGVQVRETSDVPVTRSNFITDIVFGIKWKSNYNVDLKAVPSGNAYNIVKSDMRIAKDSFYFQAFGANNTPYLLPEDWTQNTWIEILSISNTLTSADTGTFQICETGFDKTTDPNIGIDLSDYTPTITESATGVILPVRLLSFTAVPFNDAIRLNWSTITEVNNKGFELQRSEGNAANYISIAFINSKGGSETNNYDFNDSKVSGGIRYYFRLRQIDNDGTSHFSDVKNAILDKVKTALLQLSPNPANELIHLHFSNDCATKSVSIKITDSKGTLISARKETMEAGKKIDYNVSSYASGQYFLVVEDESGVIYKTAFQRM